MTKEEVLFEQAEKAMQDAADRVVEEARRTHGTVVVWGMVLFDIFRPINYHRQNRPHPNPLPEGEGT